MKDEWYLSWNFLNKNLVFKEEQISESLRDGGEKQRALSHTIDDSSDEGFYSLLALHQKYTQAKAMKLKKEVGFFGPITYPSRFSNENLSSLFFYLTSYFIKAL